jgi:hypothetical protein
MASDAKPKVSAEAPTQRVPGFVERLAAIPLDEPKRIWGLCMAEKSLLKRYRYADGDEIKSYSLSGMKNVLTVYRNAVRDRLGVTHPAFKYLRLSNDDMEEYREDYREKVNEDHTNLRPIDDEALVDTAVTIAKQAKSVDTMELTGALLLLTGRRSVEVLKTGTFAPSTTRRSVVFGGQAKRRELEATDYTIPVLADPKLVLAAIDVLRTREDTSAITNQQVNGRYSKYLGRAVARRFADNDGVALIPMELRKVYATTAYAWYCPSAISMNAYFARILGHSPLDLFTSMSYVLFYPVGQKREFLHDDRNALRDAIEAQEAALAAEPDETQRGYIAERIVNLRELAEAL